MNNNGIVKIDKGIPIPLLNQHHRGTQYPWERLEVGDSFAVQVTGYGKQIAMASAASRRYKPKRFVSRMVSETERRIWRVA